MSRRDVVALNFRLFDIANTDIVEHGGKIRISTMYHRVPSRNYFGHMQLRAVHLPA